ncbi:hypothetical protein DCC79_00585 [bacterium]|nr:hypothetical protein [Chloroflexi bacterium CFX6]RIL12673.1 MAG: hypothetical protein DCC79_00585 [bacterium]
MQAPHVTASRRSLLRRAVAFFDPAEPGFLRRMGRLALAALGLGLCGLCAATVAWTQTVTGRYWTAVVWIETERYDWAVSVAEGLVRDEPRRSYAYYRLLATALRRSGRPEAQLAVYDEAVEQFPDHSLAHGHRCWYGTLFGDPRTVIDSCDRAIEIGEGTSGSAHARRAVARALTGDRPGAIADLEAALAIWDRRDFRGRTYDTRAAWLEALRDGRDPFDDATLEQLRREF